MYPISWAEDHTAATTVSLATCPTLVQEPKWIRVGRGTFPFTSYSAASVAYRATIEHLDLGVSEAPLCEVLDDAGNVVARVGYNGKIFAVGADGEADYSIVLHETEATDVRIGPCIRRNRYDAATCPTRG